MTGPHDAGYALHEAVLSAPDIHALIGRIAAHSIPRSRAGARHILGCPPIGAVARDARLLAIASAWLKAPARPFKATLFDKNPDSNWLVAWHQDTALPMASPAAKVGWGPWSLKEGIHYAHAPAAVLERVIALRLHLDDSGPDKTARCECSRRLTISACSPMPRWANTRAASRHANVAWPREVSLPCVRCSSMPHRRARQRGPGACCTSNMPRRWKSHPECGCTPPDPPL